MAYLGAVGTRSLGGVEELGWASAVVAYVLIGEFVSNFSNHGGYIYVG